MRLLVTGGTGFVGRHLLPELAREHEVVALARTAPDAPADAVTWVKQDLAQPIDVSRLPSSIDAVIHLAQSERYREFPQGAPDVFAVNVASTAALLDWARTAGASRFVFASSGGVAGPPPLNFYLASKQAAELVVQSYAAELTTVILRFFFVYGRDQTRMLVPSLAHKVVNGDQIVVDGDPGLRVNPIHIDDAVRVFGPALTTADGGIFNVAGDEQLTITDLAILLGELAGREVNIAHSSAASGDLVGDNSRMREVLGVDPEVSLRDGLAPLLSGG